MGALLAFGLCLASGCTGEGEQNGALDPRDVETQADVLSDDDGGAQAADAEDADGRGGEGVEPGEDISAPSEPDASSPEEPDSTEEPAPDAGGPIEPDSGAEPEPEDVDPVGRWQSYFNKPTAANNYEDNTLRDRLVSYLNGAPAGAEVRAHITELSTAEKIRPVVDALVNAHNRGVKIWMVHDGNANYIQELRDLLGARYIHCGTPNVANNSGCVSDVENGTHHMKNWYFSHTKVGGDDYKWMVIASSYNITVGQARSFNDMLVVSGNEALYDAHVAVYEDYLAQEKTDDRHNEPGGKIFVPTAASYSAEFSPQKSGDMVADALSKITRYEEGCSLGVGTLNMTRSTIFNQLERIKALGCEVRVVTGTALSEGKKERLDAAGIPYRNIKETRGGKDVNLHSKMMVYRGYYETPVAQHPRENRGWVWTGSQNYTLSPLRYRDDVFVGISRGGVTTNYSDYFEVMWENAR